MFKWFRRSEPAAEKPSPAASRPRSSAVPAPSRPATPPPDTAPLPEVVAEGNTQADWSAWEDSMSALDSQMQGLPPSHRVHVRETRPSQLDDLDPFSGVGRKRDI